MSIVGPRPMEIKSVDRIYCNEYAGILRIKPGLTSAASLFDYTIGDKYADDEAYRREVLPYKLQMELMYLEKRSISYDISLILRTMLVIILNLCGKREFTYQPEYRMSGIGSTPRVEPGK
jgi:putative colanic acid biosynthesis UDP-glucose lipid carrier transferase